MTSEDATKVLEVVAGFLNENEGNKLNKWLAVPLINTVKSNLEEIIAKDEKSKSVEPEPQDESLEDDCAPGVPIPRGLNKK